ncbi:hypothetical protein PoB_004567100 [Plakobranchus ocellatus]|uniref:Uncharacterized protein n=1 Tax=Plakobranchus ocellatus TaxID=259542 RepID=A0AAV4B724_9GAST|nr:hypothetical protein PoB_004567100 [Plakobranchus ocellatus]
MVPLCKQVNGKLQKEEKCQRSSKSNDSAALPEMQGKQELEKVIDDKNNGGKTRIEWVNPEVPQIRIVRLKNIYTTVQHPKKRPTTKLMFINRKTKISLAYL